jgi:hypothetical protein
VDQRPLAHEDGGDNRDGRHLLKSLAKEIKRSDKKKKRNRA